MKPKAHAAATNATTDPSRLRRTRRRLLAGLAVAAPRGVATKRYGGPGARWVSSYAGGVVYVLFWVMVVVLIRPQVSLWLAATSVFVATCVLEAFQLFSTPLLASVRSTFLGHALIGSTFSWWDFPYYALGAVLGAALARWAVGTLRE